MLMTILNLENCNGPSPWFILVFSAKLWLQRAVQHFWIQLNYTTFDFVSQTETAYKNLSNFVQHAKNFLIETEMKIYYLFQDVVV